METFPSREFNLLIPQKLSIPTGILGSFLERSRSPQIIFFFGFDPLPKAIKAHKELSAQIFQQLNLAFLHRGTRGKGKQLNCKFLVLIIHEFSILIPACKCQKSTYLVGIKLANLNQPKCCYLYITLENFPEQAPKKQKKKKIPDACSS